MLNRRALLATACAHAAALPLAACATASPPPADASAGADPAPAAAAPTPSPPAGPASTRPAARIPSAGEFDAFVAGVKAEARGRGIAQGTLDRAFANVRYNPRVVELDRNQPEFRLTWQQYRARAVSAARVARGRTLYAQHRDLILDVSRRYAVGPGVLMGIWGLESDYGRAPGDFSIIGSLATLAFDPRRPKYFRAELLDALRILQNGDITPEKMTGSFAGAMGQTQFMPSSFLKYAVDDDGDGRRDIWNNLRDIFASTANNLARDGWRGDLPWGVPATLPPGFDASQSGRDVRRPVAEWARLGVRARDGRPLGPPDVLSVVMLPGGAGDEAFLSYWANFLAIRRYNPSDFYCCSVGIIGDLVTA